MSTPSVTILKNLIVDWESKEVEKKTVATFYRHFDGYPSGHGVDIANALILASRTKPDTFTTCTGKERKSDVLNNRNWCQHFLKVLCMMDMDIEFFGVSSAMPYADFTYVVTGIYDNFGGKRGIGSEEYLNRVKISVYEGNVNGEPVFDGGVCEYLTWADGYC